MRSVLGIATSALLGYQQSLQTIGHNIANVNTEGYSRQRLDLTQRTPSFLGNNSGGGFIGNGVQTDGIRRMYDGFLVAQVRSDSSGVGLNESYNKLAAQIDKFLSDPSVSLDSSLQGFYGAMHQVANDPTSIPARQVALGDAEDLVNRFLTVGNKLNEVRQQVNSDIDTNISDINSMAKSIADLNVKINSGQTTGNSANDLLDQRDAIIEKLSKKIGLKVNQEQNGVVDIVIGTGQALVLGAKAAELKVSKPGEFTDPNTADISLVSDITGPSGVMITGVLSGGELGGLLSFRQNVLDPSQAALGRVAAGVAYDFNKQHQLGYDLNGNAGLSLFNPTTFSATVFQASTNTPGVSLSATVTTPNKLTTSDYRVNAVGVDIMMTRLSDNVVVYNSAIDPPIPYEVDGITIDTSTLADGDSVLIQPTRSLAMSLALNATIVSDPKLIAASGSSYAVGDNANALTLAGLGQAKTLINGSASYQDAFASMVSDVAIKTKLSENNLQASSKLLNQTKESRSAVSGVNLDEEAANLIQYQQSYQAAAQMVSSVNTMFDALLGAVRR